jgi:hypothetical protein
MDERGGKGKENQRGGGWELKWFRLGDPPKKSAKKFI